MDVKGTIEFFKKMMQDNLCLLYNGMVSDELTTKVIDLSEYNINNIEELSKMRKKVSFLVAECFQNIIRHGKTENSNNNDNLFQGFFMTKNRDCEYFITSGNLINKEKIGELEDQLRKVNDLNKDELKALYREVLENEQISSKGGAGLGLIEMARKSGRKLDFIFEEYNADHSFFYNQITLNSKSKEGEIIEESTFPIQEARAFHNRMMKSNIIVIQKGDFSNDSILPVLRIIERNLQEEFVESFIKKKVYHILVELLQNVSRHCLKINGIREGIFLIGKSNGNFIINTGNYIEENKIESLGNQLGNLNKLNQNELKRFYMEKLKQGVQTVHGSAGIGLIDIARRVKLPIEFAFSDINEKKFFSISVTV